MKEKYYETLMNNLNKLKRQNNDDDDNLLERDGFKELLKFYYDEIIKMSNLIAKSIYYDVSIDFEYTSNLSTEVRKIIANEFTEIEETEKNRNEVNTEEDEEEEE